MTATKEWTENHATSEWTGFTGRLGAWYLASPFRRLAELLILGDLHPRFMERVRLRADDVVVDAGCGSGFYTLAMAEKLTTGRVICVDLSDEMLKTLQGRAARRKLAARLEVLKGDITAVDLPDGVASLAVSNGVWHELRDPEAAARELYRLLKPAGRVVVTDFRDTSLGRRIAAAHRQGDHGPFSAETLQQLLRTVGFDDVKTEVLNHWVVGWGAKRAAEPRTE